MSIFALTEKVKDRYNKLIIKIFFDGPSDLGFDIDEHMQTDRYFHHEWKELLAFLIRI